MVTMSFKEKYSLLSKASFFQKKTNLRMIYSFFEKMKSIINKIKKNIIINKEKLAIKK